MNAAVMSQTGEGSRSVMRWVAAGVAAAALFVAVLLQSAPVGAAAPDGEAIWCGGQYTNYCPLGNAGYLGGAYLGGYNGFYGYNGLYNNSVYGYRQYQDNRTNCSDGQVTQTGGGYFCTNGGGAAFVVNGNNTPYVYNGGFNGFNYTGGGYPFAYNSGYYPVAYTGGGYFPYYYGGIYRTGLVGIPYSGQVRVAEVAAPVAAPAPEIAAAPAVTTAAPVAAPAAPAQSVTALAAQPAATVDAPVQASGLGTHVQSVSAPTTPAFAPEPTGHDARD